MFSTTKISVLVLSLAFVISSWTLNRERLPVPPSGTVSFKGAVSSEEIMAVFADRNWNLSTTSLPISSVSLLAKALLSRSKEEVPDELWYSFEAYRQEWPSHDADTLPLKLVREYNDNTTLRKLRQLCDFSICDTTSSDATFGITPLHMARYLGADKSAKYLIELGADQGALDNAQRQPGNLSFQHFVKNSQLAALKQKNACEIPEVNMNLNDVGGSLAEVRRLVNEGEPLVLRGFLPWHSPQLLSWSLHDMVKEHGDIMVKSADVPYASYFGLKTSEITLKDYVSHMKGIEEREQGVDSPKYIFEKNEQITRDALETLDDLVLQAFPDTLFEQPLKLSHENIHFFLGAKNSGAPFHIHSDAINLLVSGSKRWFVYPPNQALYSRRSVHNWLTEQYENLREKPLVCEQNSGDMVYIPFDWAHAVLNLDHDTFGFALELLNRRDSFQFIQPQSLQ